MKFDDFSKTIGIVRRGGRYSPSNELSEAKMCIVLTVQGLGSDHPHPPIFNEQEFVTFKDKARECGFRIKVIERGLNR